MNRKIASAMLAVVAVAVAAQTADAKPKNWNQNGANCAPMNTNLSVNSAYYGMPNGFNNGNAAWKQNFANGYSNWGNANYNNYDRGWGNQFGNNWNNNNRNGNWGNRFNNVGNIGNIDQLQQRLSDRIARGITSGRLTQSEANRLRSMESRINELETQYRSDNRLSFNERQRLSNELNKLQDRLRRELGDRQML